VAFLNWRFGLTRRPLWRIEGAPVPDLSNVATPTKAIITIPITLYGYGNGDVREKGVPRDGAMGGSVGSARPSKSDADPRSRPPCICDPCENVYTEAERQRATAQAASAIRQAPTAMIERRPSIVVVPFLRSPIEDTREFRRALTSTV